MKRKRIAGLLLALSLVLGLIGCGSNKSEETQDSKEETQEISEEEKQGGTFTWALASEAVCLNPLLEYTTNGWAMLGPLYDPLWKIDANGEVEYFLAESYELSEDNLEITIKLRDGLKWHDGEPITADDLIYTYNIGTTEGLSSSVNLKEINGPSTIEKIDDLTAVIKLEANSSDFLVKLGILQIVPAHIFEDEEDIVNSEKNNLGIGSGPFKLVSYSPGESIVYERFDDYYGKKPYLDQLVCKIIPDVSSQEIAFQNGELDALQISTEQKYNKYNEDDNYNVDIFTAGRLVTIFFNQTSPITGNKDVREALAMALDVEEITQAAFGSESVAVPATSPFAAAINTSDTSIGYERDEEKAKELIEETGLEGKTLRILYNTDQEAAENICLSIQQQLNDWGIETELMGRDAAGYYDGILAPDNEYEFVISQITSEYNDPMEYASLYNGSSALPDYTASICTSDEQKALWDELSQTYDLEEREEVSKRLQQQILDDVSSIPIAYSNTCFVTGKNVGGIDETFADDVRKNFKNIYIIE